MQKVYFVVAQYSVQEGEATIYKKKIVDWASSFDGAHVFELAEPWRRLIYKATLEENADAITLFVAEHIVNLDTLD